MSIQGICKKLNHQMEVIPILFKLTPRKINLVVKKAVLMRTPPFTINEIISVDDQKKLMMSTLIRDPPKLKPVFMIKEIRAQPIKTQKLNLMRPEFKTKEEKDLDLIEAHKNFFGHGKAKDLNKAKELYTKCAEQGMAEAHNCLGKMNLEGVGCKVDNKQAFRHYESSSRNNNPEGHYKLGTMHLNKLINKNLPEEQRVLTAKDLISKAAKFNHLEAVTEMGYLAEKGIGQPVNLGLAKQFYREASKGNNPRAMNNLACILMNEKNSDDVEGNSELQAYGLLTRARELGYNPAIANLAECYLNGVCVKKDLVIAKNLFKEAADKNDPEAKFKLAFFQLRDASLSGNPENYVKAADELRKTLCLNPKHSSAHYYLGFMHENGLGVDRDITTAFNHFQKAVEYSEGKDEKALYKLGNLYVTGLAPGGQDIHKAIVSYQCSAQLGDPDACNALG